MNVNYGKLVLNAVLAGLWAFLGVLVASNAPTSRAIIWGAAAVGVRAAIGVITAAVGPGVPVDK